jgi:hypothetical protein
MAGPEEEETMHRRALFGGLVVALALCIPLTASAGVLDVTRCQKKFARYGARYAWQAVKSALRCTNEISECQIQCEQGVFGPPCSSNPPPCCDPEDPNSNEAFGQCMDEAQEVCDEQAIWIAGQEVRKQERIVHACEDLTTEELCSSEATGLNFATLNAGCLALDPGYVCNLQNLITCVGGPLEQVLSHQIAALLDPRAPEAIAALDLHEKFPGIPVARKVKQEVADGKVDLWSVTGQAGDEIRAMVRTVDDGDGTASLAPALTLLGTDGQTPVGETTVINAPCPVPPECGGGCPQLQRRLPFSGTYLLAVGSSGTPGCGEGRYRMVVMTPGGALPSLVSDDVDPPFVLP